MYALIPLGSWLFLSVQLFLYVHLGNAANCTLPNWGWASNSLGQGPCEVTVLMEGGCWNEGGPLAALQPGYNYVTPQLNGTPPAVPCECNTIMYSLYQACTACQNVSMETWTYFEKNCPVVYVSQYPGQIPITTRVPHWAYLNVTLTNNMFDVAVASAAANLPDSTPLMPSTVSLAGSSSSSSSSASTSAMAVAPVGGSSTFLGSPSQSVVTNASKSSNTGAIAGGTVGGVVGLALIGGAIAFFLYRRRKQASVDNHAVMVDNLYSDTPSTTTFKPYNPSDPSTFPRPLEQSSSDYESRAAHSTTYIGGYHGVAEV